MKIFFIFLVNIIFFSCTSVDKLYMQAVQDASVPEKKEVNKNLTQVSKENASLVRKQIRNEDYILVVSWKKNVSYYKNDPVTGFYNTGNFPVWVTIAPELKNFIKKNHLQYPYDTLRIKQLLGLPPVNTYLYFVTFWVKPTDLFRPCPDAEIEDNSCDLQYPLETTCEHFIFINNLQQVSYSDTTNLFYNYPWTQLGYTYDWNKKSKYNIGLSEFVISRNADVFVDTIYTTEQYFNTPDIVSRYK